MTLNMSRTIFRYLGSIALVGALGTAATPATAASLSDQEGTAQAVALAAANKAWSEGATSKALGLYDVVLSLDPDNRDALLRTGTVLSWQQKYGAAIRRFERLLDKHPDDLDGLEGKASCLVGLGVNHEALPLLERLIARSPERLAPKLSLAWLNLFASPRDAATTVQDLRHRFPNDTSVQALSKVSSRMNAPRFSIGQGRNTDNLKNEVEGTIAEGQFSLSEGRQIKFSAGRQLVSAAGTSVRAEASAADATLVIDLTGGRRLSLKGGVEAQKGTAKKSNVYPVYAVNWQFGANSRLSGRLGSEREPVRNTVGFVDLEIRADKASGGLSYKASRGVTLGVDAFASRISSLSGNANRYGASAGIQKRLTLAGLLPVYAGYEVSVSDISRDLKNGYWMPANQFSQAAFVRTFLFLPSGFGFFGSTQLSRTSYTSESGPVPYDIKGSLSLFSIGVLTVPLGKSGLSLELFGAKNLGSLDESNGFRSTGIGAKLVWQGGQAR